MSKHAPIIAIVFLVFLLLWVCSSCYLPEKFRVKSEIDSCKIVAKELRIELRRAMYDDNQKKFDSIYVVFNKHIDFWDSKIDELEILIEY